jgi:hypothetical protein
MFQIYATSSIMTEGTIKILDSGTNPISTRATVHEPHYLHHRSSTPSSWSEQPQPASRVRGMIECIRTNASVITDKTSLTTTPLFIFHSTGSSTSYCLHSLYSSYIGDECIICILFILIYSNCVVLREFTS